MANLLGTVSGKIKIDVSQALAAYISVQKANRDTTNALRQISGTLNTFGNALGVVGIGLAGALGYAAKEAANFNAQMDYFQAISGATANQMDQIRQKALQLDQTTMFSTQDIANMFVELGKAGEGTDAIVGGVADAVVNLAQAAQIPLNSAVTTVVSVLSAFNLKAGQASDVADRLAGAANASILEVSDLATALKYVSGVADQLGISFDETTTALDLLGQAGIKGSMGGTELRQILVSILGTTKPAAAELKKLGIITKDGANQFFDASGKAKSLSDIFQILQDHLKGLNQEQQLAALKTIFNNRALSAAAILTKEGAKGFADMNAQIAGTTAADVAAKRMDNLSGDVKKLTSSLKTMAIQAGQPLQQFLRQIVQSLTQLVHWFENLSPSTQANIIHMLALAAALLIASSVLIKVVAFAIRLAETLGKLAAAARFLWAILVTVGEVLADVLGAVAASTVGLIVLVVLALAAAFFLLYEKVKPVHDFFNMLGRGIRTGFEATVKWFEGLPRFFEHMWADIKSWFTDGVNGVKGAWDSVVRFFEGIGNSIASGVTKAYDAVVNFFTQLPGEAAAFASKAGDAIGNFFSNLPYKIGYALGFVLGTIARWVIEAYQKFVEWVNNTEQAIGNFFIQLPGRIENWLIQSAIAIANWIAQTRNDIGQWIVDVAEALANFFEALPGRVENWLLQFAIKLIRFEQQAKQDIGQWIIDVGNALYNFFITLPTKVGNWLTGVIKKIGDFYNQAVNWAGQIGMNFVNGILNWLNQLPGLVWQAIQNTINAFTSMVSSAFDAAKSFAKGLWDGFKKGLGINSPSYIEKAMFQISDTMKSETGKISDYVKQVNGLGQKMMDMNPVMGLQGYPTSLHGQGGQMLTEAAYNLLFGSSLPPGYFLSGASGLPAMGIHSGPISGGQGQPTKVLEVNVYNPVAEQTSTTVTQQLRTLASMGAF
jgi:TP901 family phage tail tape measure protein